MDIVPEGLVPTGWCRVFDGLDGQDRAVTLVHEDSAALRRIAVYDVLVNNADRKGGHVLAMPDGHRYGVDHGVTFHVADKLRTVLWGWLGSPLTEDECASVRHLLEALDTGLRDELEDLLAPAEVAAFARRCEGLLQRGTLPAPSGEWPAIPWPPF